MTDKINEKPSSLNNILMTEDGSETLVSSIFGERYHSIYGAKTESQVVFINAGLKDKSDQNEVSILEMGFGTGLNAYMSWIESNKTGQIIHYTGYEKFPVQDQLWKNIHYPQLLESSLDFCQLHELEWNEKFQLSEFFHFHKILNDISELNDLDEYDVIYFDAFAPSAQEELWTKELFDKLYLSLKENGVLVTYCAKGYVKRNLKSVGFTIEALPGPPGKREMTRARK